MSSEHDNLDRVLNALREVDCTIKQSSINEWQAQCPAHDDSNPSLSITQKQGGTVLLYCHAGCDTKMVLHHLGLTFKDLIPNSEHFSTGSRARPRRAGRTGVLARQRKTRDESIPWDEMLWEHKRALDNNITLAHRIESSLGLDIESFRLLLLGYSRVEEAYTFPMLDEFGKIIGVRLRNDEGKKWAIRGSVSGIFYPDPELVSLSADDPMFICEGPTDTAAMINLGFFAAGRPSCHGGADYMLGLVLRMGFKDVVIITDLDGPGLAGAAKLAAMLCRHKRQVRIMPPGKGKDPRQWVVEHGATRQSVLGVADSQGLWDPRAFDERSRTQAAKRSGGGAAA